MSRDADVTADLEARMRARQVPIPVHTVGGVEVFMLGRMVRLQRKGSAYLPAAKARAVVPVDVEQRLIHHGCGCNKENPQHSASVIQGLENGYTFCRNRGGTGIK